MNMALGQEWFDLVAKADSLEAYKNITKAYFDRESHENVHIVVWEMYTRDVMEMYPNNAEEVFRHYSKVYYDLKKKDPLWWTIIKGVVKVIHFIFESRYK